jgi:tetratricopeptide (TPR) repeat protein
MTDNHLLLYRLASLMLEHEQHVLPVDMLFDDKQVGDFVKSIQIDSPYQQFLLEGVLTESVRDEKLYVSFTVEGYFHYVLGEVIYFKTDGKSGQHLGKIFRKNKLLGLSEGIKQCLIRDVKKGNLSRIIEMIDIGGELFDLCSIPLAYSLLQYKGNPNTDIEIHEAYKIRIDEVIHELYKEFTENDIKILKKIIEYLESIHRNDILILLYKSINEYIKPNTLLEASLYVYTIKYLTESERTIQLKQLTEFQVNEESEEVALFYNLLADQLDFNGEYHNAKFFYEKSLYIYKHLHGEKHHYVATLYNNLATVVRSSGNYEHAINYYKQALEIRLNIFDDLAIPVGISYNNIGVAQFDNENYNEALVNYEKALNIFLKVCGDFHPITGFIYNNIGLIKLKNENFEIAVKYFERALSIRLKIYGENHPDTATTLNCIGGFWYTKKDYSKAIEYFEKALKIRINIYGKNHVSLATSYNNIGSILSDMGEFERAINLHENALGIYLVNYDEDYPDLLDTKFNLGLNYIYTTNYYKAIELLNSVYKYEKQGGIPAYIGLAYEGLNQLDNAFTYHIQAAELRKVSLGLQNNNTIDSINKCIKIAFDLNKIEFLPDWIKKTSE